MAAGCGLTQRVGRPCGLTQRVGRPQEQEPYPYQARHRIAITIKKQGSIEISTHSYTGSEVERLRAALLKNFNIESTRPAYNKAKEQSILRIPKREVSKVQALVSKLIPNSTAYRVGLSSSSE